VQELDERLLVRRRRPRFRRDGTWLSVLVDVLNRQRRPIQREEYEGADGIPIAPSAGIDAGDGCTSIVTLDLVLGVVGYCPIANKPGLEPRRVIVVDNGTVLMAEKPPEYRVWLGLRHQRLNVVI